MRRELRCVLIVMFPQHSHVMYIDSGNAQPKNFDDIKLVLDKALTGFAAKAGPLKHQRPMRGGLTCIHTTKFAYMRQSHPDNGMDGWFTLLQMREFVRDAHALLLPPSLQGRCASLSDAQLAEVRSEFRKIQREIATIIQSEVCHASGLFFQGHVKPTNAEIKRRLMAIRDGRVFNTLEGIKPFPPSQ